MMGYKAAVLVDSRLWASLHVLRATLIVPTLKGFVIVWHFLNSISCLIYANISQGRVSSHDLCFYPTFRK